MEIAHEGHVVLWLVLATATPISGFLAFTLLVLTLLVSPTFVCFVDRFTPAMLTPALVPERRCAFAFADFSAFFRCFEGEDVRFDTHSGSSVDIGVRSKQRGTQALVGKQGRVRKGAHVRREAGEERRGGRMDRGRARLRRRPCAPGRRSAGRRRRGGRCNGMERDVTACNGV